MPHLSPMNWIMMAISLMLSILIINSIMWWNKSTKFLNQSTSLKNQYKSWKW